MIIHGKFSIVANKSTFTSSWSLGLTAFFLPKNQIGVMK